MGSSITIFKTPAAAASHVTDENGTLKEWYRYDLQGSPFIYDANNNQLSTTNRSVRHLFTGQQWYQELGLYDLRNRFYSPDIGRFLQPDPIGFRGGNNLYRYCRNNPVTNRIRSGYGCCKPRLDGGGDVADYEPQYVNGESEYLWREPLGLAALRWSGGSGTVRLVVALLGTVFHHETVQHAAARDNEVGFDIYHPKTTAKFIIAGNIIEHGDDDTAPVIDLTDFSLGG
jgi:RHS repeat-associated protein